MKTNLIVAAAGLSQRYGTENKLFEKCGTSCVLLEAIKPFLQFSQISKIIVSLDTTYFDEFLNWLSVLHLDEDGRITPSIGGNTRTKSVRNAVSSLEEDCGLVLVHDGARPYVSAELIARILKEADSRSAVVPLLPLVDNLAEVCGNTAIPRVRDDFRLVQTPCAFDRNVFEKAYLNVTEDALDDITVVSKYADVYYVDGDRKNVKITTKADLKTPLVGCGYDIHRMEKGRGIKLLGTYITCPYSFIAHSDGDVPVHAVMDAILSAIGEKDIGHLFPVNDAKYDNADSFDLLEQVLSRAAAKGYAVNNVTVAIIAEEPMLAPYIDEMRARTSAILNIPAERVGITATTNEQVGDLGAAKAIASYATVLLFPAN